MDFGAGRNNPAAHFQHATQAFALMDALTNAVAQSFLAPLQVPPHSLIDVALDFECATDMLTLDLGKGRILMQLFFMKPFASNIFLNKPGLYLATF
jgi:hypothetical protein